MALLPSDNWRVTLRLRRGWDTIVAAVAKMHSAAELHPGSYADAFRTKIQDNGSVSITIGPIVMFVPEKGRTTRPSLYIVVRGRLDLEDIDGENLQTLSYGSEIGYFREASGNLIQVHGMHCDIDEARLAHPLFHVQFEPFPDMPGQVARHFAVPEQIDPESPAFKRVNTIRIPSAQLDPFALIAQICADHLLHSESDEDARAAFIDVLDAFSFIHGAAYRMPALNAPPGSRCYRSHHWYNRP